MSLRNIFALSAATLLAATAASGARLVTNLEMCAFTDPIDSQEMGMTLTETEMFEIEFFCEMSEPITLDWDVDRVETRMGYCSEPGFTSPHLWSFVFSPYEPGKVTVWWQGAEDATEFQSCE